MRLFISIMIALMCNCIDCEAKIWAILVADTQDKDIGRDDRKSNHDLNLELKAIAKCLNTPITIINIVGKDAYDKRNLSNAIKTISPTNDDIVFFCYNGHGFRFDNQKDAYPNICMMPSSSDDMSYVSTTDIFNSIKAKGARLNIVITDCCNSKAGVYKPRRQRNTVFTREQPVASKERMKDLFLRQHGDVLATAAKPGEYSWSFEGEGSVLTNAFISAVRNESKASRKAPVSWKHLLDTAIDSARKETLECENAQHGMRYVSVQKK